jgi:hypothetical protein
MGSAWVFRGTDACGVPTGCSLSLSRRGMLQSSGWDKGNKDGGALPSQLIFHRFAVSHRVFTMDMFLGLTTFCWRTERQERMGMGHGNRSDSRNTMFPRLPQANTSSRHGNTRNYRMGRLSSGFGLGKWHQGRGHAKGRMALQGIPVCILVFLSLPSLLCHVATTGGLRQARWNGEESSHSLGG